MENKLCVKHKLNFHATRWFNNIIAHKVHGGELCFFIYWTSEANCPPNSNEMYTHILSH